MTRFCIKTCQWLKTLIFGLRPPLRLWPMAERHLSDSVLPHDSLTFQCMRYLPGSVAECHLPQ